MGSYFQFSKIQLIFYKAKFPSEYTTTHLRASFRFPELSSLPRQGSPPGRVGFHPAWTRSTIRNWRWTYQPPCQYFQTGIIKNNTNIRNVNLTDNALDTCLGNSQRSKIKLTRSLLPPCPRSPATSPCSRPVSPRSSSHRHLHSVLIGKRRSFENRQLLIKCGAVSSKRRPTHPPPTRWSSRCPWWSRQLYNGRKLVVCWLGNIALSKIEMNM